jgi:hypothetical protein
MRGLIGRAGTEPKVARLQVILMDSVRSRFFSYEIMGQLPKIYFSQGLAFLDTHKAGPWVLTQAFVQHQVLQG